MKKIVLSILLLLSFAYSEGQNRFPTTDSLQNYVLRYVKNSSVESFTNLRLQNILIGLSQMVDTLRNAGYVDSIWIGADDTLKYRIGNTTFKVGKISGGGSTDSSIFATRYWTTTQYRPITWVPTLQEVTTQGRRTTDSIVFVANNENTQIGAIYQTSTGPDKRFLTYQTGSTLNSAYTQLTPSNLTWVTTGGNTLSITTSLSSPTDNRTIRLPDTSGVITIGAKVNGTTYMAGANGIVDIGTIGGVSTLQLTDSLNTNGVTGITLNTPNVIFGTPVTFSKTGRSWSGTLAINNQSANTILAGPSSGSAAAPTFRTLVDADIPSTSKGVQWAGVDSAFSYDQVRTGYHESIRFITQPYISNIRPWGNVVNGLGAITQGAEYVVLSTSTYSNNGAGINPATTFNSTPSAAAIAFGNYLSSAYSVYTIRVRIPTLNDGTERFHFSCGLLSNASPGAPVDGAAIYYDLNGTSTGSTAASYWQTMTASSSSRTWNQSHTQVTVQANTWVTIRIVVNTSQALFYVNNTLIGTHTTNIPSSSVAVSPYARIGKTNGTTARTAEISFITLDQKYSTPL
jgi:hypothetical protein